MTTTSALSTRGGRALVLARLYGVGAIVGAFALPPLGAAITALTGPAPAETVTAGLIVVALLLAPIAEEFAFRWLPFALIERPRFAILAGAVAFGATHWVVHPASGVVAFAAGLLLGWVYARRRVIWDSIAVHAGINAGALALSVLLGGGVV